MESLWTSASSMEQDRLQQFSPAIFPFGQKNNIIFPSYYQAPHTNVSDFNFDGEADTIPLVDPEVTKDNDMECVKRPFQPNNLKRRRNHGFLQRKRTVGGRNVLKRRLEKGRHSLVV